jgi:hypothetical protein
LAALIFLDCGPEVKQNVPLSMVSKWMGHSWMETTAIYANAVGEEQQSIAARMWAR